MRVLSTGWILCLLAVVVARTEPGFAEEPKKLGPLPLKAKLALAEDWSSGKIESKRWYALRKKWGENNFGVVPENVTIVGDTVGGKRRQVLRCEAHGDEYSGPVTGQWKRKRRVGGVLVSKQHFASGRFEVEMKIGSVDNPRPKGIVPAIWTYGYRAVAVQAKLSDDFSPTQPLYQPYLQKWGKGQAFYWSELDFPEYGKGGKFDRPMYNTFLNSKHQPLTFDAHGTADGSDYEAASGTLTFAPGETSRSIIVAINGDTDNEPHETFVVDLSNPSNATLGDAQATGTIHDNDAGFVVNSTDDAVDANPGDGLAQDDQGRTTLRAAMFPQVLSPVRLWCTASPQPLS